VPPPVDAALVPVVDTPVPVVDTPAPVVAAPAPVAESGPKPASDANTPPPLADTLKGPEPKVGLVKTFAGLWNSYMDQKGPTTDMVVKDLYVEAKETYLPLKTATDAQVIQKPAPTPTPTPAPVATSNAARDALIQAEIEATKRKSMRNK
jgi:hypothetical protein